MFISVNNLQLVADCKYLAATPLCSGGEECNKDGEMRYMAKDSINEEYFSETTSEVRKDEIIEQILMEVVEALSRQCSPDEYVEQQGDGVVPGTIEK